MYCSPDNAARALQDYLREELAEKRHRYELLKTSEAKTDYLLALKKFADMACWRIGG